MRLQVLCLIAFIGLFCYCNAETPAAVYNVLQRKIALNSRFTNQILPPCFEADYDVTSTIPNFCSTATSGTITYQNFAVDFYPTENVAPFPEGTTSVQLVAVYSDGSESVIPITSTIDDNIESGANYLGSPDCSISEDSLTGFIAPGSYNNNTGCSFVYYCEEFCNSRQPSSLYIAVTTDSNENEDGISFDLEILSLGLTIRELGYNTSFVANSTVSAVNSPNNFLGSQYQDLYYVDVGPLSETLLGIGAFNALTVFYTELVFQISAVTESGGQPACASNQDWNLYVNSGDLAISEPIGSNRIITSENFCNDGNNNSTNLCENPTLEVTVPGCDSAGTYFISVAYPDDVSTSYRYTIKIFYRAIDAQELPAYTILSNNSQVATSYIGNQPNDLTSYAVQERYFLIDIPQGANTTDLFVTVFNVDQGTVNVQVRPATLGFEATCPSTVYTCVLNADNDTNVDDYCKIKVPACEIAANTPYWVTVQGTPAENSPVVYFSVNAAFVPIALSAVSSLSATTVVGGTVYTDINTVNEQAYNHYLLTVPASSVNYNSLLVVTVYPNQEQNEIVFNYNQGALAGSYGVMGSTPGDVDGPKDECFSSIFVCASANKVATQIFFNNNNTGTDAPSIVPHCVLTIPYCQLLDTTQHYFSVYGVDSSPTSFYYDNAYPNAIAGELGYSRPVHYTITFALYNAPVVLNNGQTYNQVQFPSYSQNTLIGSGFTVDQISRQYQFTVPTSTVRQAFSEVVFFVEAVTFPPVGGELVAYAQCATQAGPCPCYSNEYTCSFTSTNDVSKCAITLPVCNCPEKVFYLSVVVTTPPSAAPVAYTVAALGLSQAVATSFKVPSTIVQKLRPQDVDFFSTGYSFDSNPRYIYGSDLHRYRYTAVANQAIRITVRFSEPIATNFQALLLSVGNEDLSPVDPYFAEGSDCVTECLAISHEGFLTNTRVRNIGDNYCTIVIDPCNAPSDDYFIRVVGISGTADLTQFAGADYTLQVENDNYTPVALSLGSKTNGAVLTDEQDFYSISLTGIALDQWVRVVVYQDAGYPNDLAVYYNLDQIAGSKEQTCYEHLRQCRIEATRSYCDFFLAACDLQGHSTLYVTVHASRISLDSYDDYVEAYHQIGDAPIPYTVEIQTGNVISLNDGVPRTSSILRRQDDYYTFTIPTGFTNIFHFNLNSEEPRHNADNINSLFTYVGETSPGSSNCGCGDLVFTDTFNTKEFPCNAPPGTYYVRVRAEDNGAVYDIDPVTYTIRAWIQPILLETLTLNASFVAVPSPLDYNQWVDYTITLPSGGLSDDELLYIDIADLTNSADYVGNNGIIVYLNYGTIATPGYDNPTFSDGSACFVDSLNITTTLDAFNGTTVAQFIVKGCDTCDNVIHVTINSNFEFPLPYAQRANFSIRAYTQGAVTPSGFPSSTSFRNQSLDGGFTFTFDDINDPVVYVSDTYGYGVQQAYIFVLPTLTLNNYESLQVTVGNNEGLDVFFGILGECTEFTQVTACSAAGTYQFYGIVYSTDTNNGEQDINGLTIEFVISQSDVYTAVSSSFIVPSNGGNVTGTVNPGQYAIVQYSFTGVNINQIPQVTLSVIENSGSISYCFNSYAPLTNPGCETCDNNNDLVLISCCTDITATIYITIYNSNQNSNSASFTVVSSITTTATGLSSLTLPISKTTGSISTSNSGLYQFYSFQLTPTNFALDSVLTFRINPTNDGDLPAVVYLQRGGFAGEFESEGESQTNCVSNFFTCTAGDDSCNVQLPLCFFGSEYGVYYIGLLSNSGTSSNGTSLSIFVTNVVVITEGSTGVSGTVPDISDANSDTLSQFKFQYNRIVNELGLLEQNVGLVITLTTPNNVNNSLSLYIRDSRGGGFDTENPLAGPQNAFSNVLQNSCQFDYDNSPWTCNSTSTPQNGGSIQCIAVFCQEIADFLAQGNDDYIYLGVQNNAEEGSNVPTKFTLSVQSYSTPIENTTVIFPITPVASSNDNIVNTTCSTSGNSNGGCNFHSSSFTNAEKAVFKVDFTKFPNLGIYDYFTVNITSLDTSIDVYFWTSDECENTDTPLLSCDAGAIDCYYATSPCDTLASYLATGDGTNDQSISIYGYFAITWQDDFADFNIEFHTVTPLSVVVPLSAATPSFAETYIMWDYRYVVFNFEVPQTHYWDFSVSVTADCNNSPLSVFANPFHYVLSSPTCAQISSSVSVDGVFTDFVPSCVSGGNYFLAVTYDHFDLIPTNVTAPEGRLHPQIKVTVEASITKIPFTPLGPRCSATVTQDEVFVVTLDGENFGTEVFFSIEECNAQNCGLTVVTPHYEGDWNTAFYNQQDSECQPPVCDDANVYCCNATASESCVITVDYCTFLSGNYYLYYSQDGVEQSTIRSYYDRKDIQVITLNSANSYHANISTEFVNTKSYFNQYVKIVTDGNNLGLEVQITFPDLTNAGSLLNFIEKCAYTLDCTDLTNAFQVSIVSSTQWPVSAAEADVGSCIIDPTDTISCDANFPYTCIIRDLGCPRTEYLISLAFPFTNQVDRPIPISLVFAGSSTGALLADFKVLQPGVPLCGSVWGIVGYQTNIASYQYENDDYAHQAGDYYEPGRYFETTTFDYRFNLEYPYVVYYQVNLAGVNTEYATLVITGGAQQQNTSYPTPNVYYGVTPPTSECNICSSEFHLGTLDTITLACGIQESIWIAVEAGTVNAPVVDYWIQVDIIQKPSKALSIPSISGHNVATTSATFTTETVYTVNNANQNVVILSAVGTNAEVASILVGQDQGSSCSSGCVAVDSCPLSEPIVYGIDVIPNAPVACETVGSSSVTVTYQSIVSVTVGTLYNFTICPDSPVDSHLYSVNPSSFSADLIQGLLFELYSVTPSNNVGVSFECNTLPCSDFYSFSSSTSFVYLFDFGCEDCQPFFTVTPEYCGTGSCVTYSFVIQESPRPGDLSGTALTNVWLGEYFDYYALETVDINDAYVTTAGADSFIHVAIGNANSTVSLSVYNGAAIECLVGTCQTGGSFLDDDSNANGFNGGQSCYVFSTATSGETFNSIVQLIEEGFAYTYKIQAITSWTALTATPIVAQIIGNNRQYYKIVASTVESVILHLDITNGPRLFVQMSDTPAFLFGTAEPDLNRDFYRTTYCHFGECRIEIPTLAVHPGSTTFYVLVSTILATNNNQTDSTNIEKPTNYQISATLGTQNCASPSTFALNYCSGVLTSSGSYWNYLLTNLKDEEAECFFNDINCFCPTATAPCQAQLQTFACVETFRQCDSNGFIAPVCRGECFQVEEQCGLFTCSYFASTCGSARYNTAEPCSGVVSTLNTTIDQQPALAPYVTVNTDPQSSVVPSSTSTVTPFVATGSNFPTPSISQTFLSTNPSTPSTTAVATPTSSPSFTTHFTGTHSPTTTHTHSGASTALPALFVVILSIIVLAF